ncbi:peptide/nickel transport system substrate-binding protein [Microbacterium sp. W4I4]|uniref:ABC transporter substrate-binding protein n=1 Tax=Microbacterium sp. W4I4 TaxID=3042295 RepID=UPI0027842F93|nr:ABC transporter substrate-binding protein [Microbacterium sp. W4I4]MDQ0614129.1 peptide/nickel transport system substrate-binding protein [Microbacterium sp. W4I4]
MRTRHRKHLMRVLCVAAATALMATPATMASASAPSGIRAAESTAPPTSDADSKTLRIATSGFVDSFNPFTSIYLLPTNTLRYTYEFLVQFAQEDGSPTKGLADSWETSEGGKVWTFTLQDGLKWSDGEPITSEDVKYTYETMMSDPALGVANGNLLANLDSIDTPDEKTVVLTMTAPQAPNPGVEIPVVPKHVWEKIDNPAEYPNDKDVVGSGPFLLESYKANQFITLKANPDFWRGAPKIDKIQYIYYTNSDAQVQALRSGDVDMVTGLTATQYEALKNVDGITVHSGQGRRYSSIGLNSGWKTRTGEAYGNGNPALQDVAVRQAIRLGTDIETLLDKVLGGYGVLATSFVPASYPNWTLPADSPVIMKYDPDAAKKKLDEAGWAVGADGIRVKDGQPLKLRLFVDSSSITEQSEAEYFVPWMKEIGIQVDIESTDVDTISAETSAGNYDMYFSGWSMGADPDFQLGINTCANLPTGTDGSGGTSQDGWCDPEFDKLYDEQHTELDPEKRKALVQEMLEMNYEATAQVATWYANSLEAYRSDRFTDFSLMPKKGGIIANQSGYWGYLTVHAVGDAETAKGGPNVGLLVTGGVVGVLVIGAVILLMVRRRRSADIE